MAEQIPVPDFSDKNSEKAEWSCACSLCRLIALPIFERFVKPHKEVNTRSEEVLSMANVVQQPVSSSTVDENVNQSVDVNMVVSKVVEEIDKKVSPRIDSVEKELENVRNSFAGVVEELRNAIIEVRAAVSELANPFNFMRRYAEIVDDSGKLLQLLAPQGVQQSSSSQQVPSNALAPIVSQLPMDNDIRMLLSSILTQQRSLSSQQSSFFARVLRLIKWVDEHLIGVPREVIEELMSFAVSSGLIGEKEKNLLLSTISFIENMRKKGVRVREQLIMLYTIAKMLGVEDREADGEILKIVIEESKLSLPGDTSNGI